MPRPKKEPLVMQPESDTVGLSIRWMEAGDSVRYSCGGFHLNPEDAEFLPEGKSKIEPGDVIQLPRDVAEKYRGNRKVEIV